MANITPSFSDITPNSISSPSVGDWYTSEQVENVPDTVAPYLAAHGYLVNGASPLLIEGEFGGWWLDMKRQSFDHDEAIQELLDRMTVAYNEGRSLNDTRYEDLMTNFGDLIAKAQIHMDAAKVTLDDQISIHMTTLSSLETEYDAFFVEVQADLDSLTVDLAASRLRVNNSFDAQLAASDQGLVNRGFYSSAMVSTIDAGIEEKRAQALLEIDEKEQTLIADITLKKNSIYQEVLQMRQGLIGAKMGLTEREQKFLGYQLDTRNNLALAMYKVVEGREDGYPGLESQAALVTSLGDDGA